MDSPSFTLDRPASEVLQITLRGQLTETAMLVCERDIRTALAQARHGALRVLVDLRAVDEYDLEARDVLVRITTHLLSKAARTAFLADTAHSRALALWIAHMNNGNKSSMIECPEVAAHWLRDAPEASGVHALQSQPPGTVAN